MRHAPVALYASEELEQPVLLDKDAPLAIAIDPLDGSSNIDTNVSIGTIFSLLPATGAPDADPAASFLQAGANQLAAGFFIYGPQLALVLSLGSGTHVFVLSTRLGTFVQAYESRIIPPRTQEFAINAANYRHWDEAVRLYVDDCLKGCEGPREKDFNMRWIASLVADCYRILMRGGVFLYPGDQRKGYHQGRLRLVYEANPIAFLIEQAGGAATDTVSRILEIAARAACTSACRSSSDRRGSRSHRPLPHRAEQHRRACAAVRQSRPVPRLTGGSNMSAKHPIISITGSSGAGTTSVKRIFEQIFRREKIEAAFIEGDAFHRYDRAGDEGKGRGGGEGRAIPTSPTSTPRPTSSRSSKRCSRNMAAGAPARPAPMSMTTRKPSSTARRRERSPNGAISRRATCSSTRACMAAPSPTRSISPGMPT